MENYGKLEKVGEMSGRLAWSRLLNLVQASCCNGVGHPHVAFRVSDAVQVLEIAACYDETRHWQNFWDELSMIC